MDLVGAVPRNGFWKMRPVDDQPASEWTEAWITYDSSNLYVAFRAHDSQPERVRASLSPRDKCDADDVVGVLLDTFHDGRRAYPRPLELHVKEPRVNLVPLGR